MVVHGKPCSVLKNVDEYAGGGKQERTFSSENYLFVRRGHEDTR